MSGFDQGRVYQSDDIGGVNRSQLGDLNQSTLTAQETSVTSRFRKPFYDFIEHFENAGGFKYRDQLAQSVARNMYLMELDINDLRSHNSTLAEDLVTQPLIVLPAFESATKEFIANRLLISKKDNERVKTDQVPPVQIQVKTDHRVMEIRDLHTSTTHISKVVKIPGVVVAANMPRSKAVNLKLMCRKCHSLRDQAVKPGLGGAQLPRVCETAKLEGADAGDRCPLDPYIILADECKCIDVQTLKLQETPESVPTGELPGHISIACEQYLVNRVVPGTRVIITGVYTFSDMGNRQRGGQGRSGGTRVPYIRALHIEEDVEGSGRTNQSFSPQEEADFRQLSQTPDLWEKISKSIAPAIYGQDDIKKAVACLLFAGTRKQLKDGMRLRGDVNVLLLGDPGTAKSQVLKFVHQIAPTGVYTSGKGSSAAGLTASVIRDSSTREFRLEAGAMVLADGGVVCIDEFDKMREDDRVVIHEAMEQQTISIAKAGITTVLNSRTAVMAAANGVYGRWDDTKDASDNINFQTTILSRFDLIFIVRDTHETRRDVDIARHVLRVHSGTARHEETTGPIEFDLLKRYIAYCRSRAAPRLSESAAELLKDQFVSYRQKAREAELRGERSAAIPLTIRQLEALIRISEAIAKTRLSDTASEEDVEEALRLFKVSTLTAAMQGHLNGAEGLTSRVDANRFPEIENFILQRLNIGQSVKTSRLIETCVSKGFNEFDVKRVLDALRSREEIQQQFNGQAVLRIR
eukprot:Clim_evm69s210 gene=Clim_evmTU69s210